jgi:hypothetical protein
MKKSIPLFIACALAQCDVWQKPLIEPILKETKKADSIEKIMVTKYPYPNTFSRDSETLAVLKDGGAAVWENECALEVSGITSGGETRTLTAPEYTVDGFDPAALTDGNENPVTVTLNGASDITTSFDIAIVSFSGTYYEVKIADGISNGALVPFPSKAKDGETVTVYIHPDERYAYKESGVLIPPPPQVDITKDTDDTFTFIMPGSDVTITAEFFKAEAKLEREGQSAVYYETLEEAFSGLESGKKAAITLLCDVEEQNSGITVSGNVTLTAAPGAAKTISRGGGFTGSLFTVGSGASLALDAGYSLGLTLDGKNISVNSPLVTVSGGALTMGGRVTLQNNNNNGGNDGGGVYLNGGLFEMTGGKISGNKVPNGGGVYLNSGAFNINGDAVISGNKASYGGGVYINGGLFEMTGGAVISGNTAAEYNDLWLALGSGGKFNADGGMIGAAEPSLGGGGVYIYGGQDDGGSMDYFDQTLSPYGGGVYINDGTFEMTGGGISGNIAGAGNGGGVSVRNSGQFKMSGEAVISGNTAAKGSGVYDDGAFMMSGSAVVKQEVFLADGREITVSGQLELPAGETYSAEIRLENPESSPLVLKGVDDASGSSHSLNFADISKFRLSPQSSGGGKGFSLNTDDNSVKLVDESSGAAAGESYYSGGGTRIYGDLMTIIDNVSGTEDAPAIISIVDDITLPPPTSDGAINIFRKHIKLTVPDNTEISIRRGRDFTGSLFTVNAGASLTLGGSRSGSLTLDGGKDDGINAASALVTVDGGTLNMGDGVTLENNNNSGSYGGGVYVESGMFTMSGGTISNNTATSTDYGEGGGVYVGEGGEFIMSGGTISYNTATHSNGGSVHVESSTFTMSGGTVSNNTGGGVCVRGSEFTMSYGTISGNTASNYSGGGVLILTSEVTMSGGTISDNTSKEGGGVCVWSGEFTMSGGIINGNTATLNGGGVYIQLGTFNITAGEINGNSANSRGGGVYQGTGSTFTMSGGTINGSTGSQQNTAPSGGAAYFKGGGTSNLGTTDNTIIDGGVQ